MNIRAKKEYLFFKTQRIPPRLKAVLRRAGKVRFRVYDGLILRGSHRYQAKKGNDIVVSKVKWDSVYYAFTPECQV